MLKTTKIIAKPSDRLNASFNMSDSDLLGEAIDTINKAVHNTTTIETVSVDLLKRYPENILDTVRQLYIDAGWKDVIFNNGVTRGEPVITAYLTCYN